jgi:hypothetical protein
MAKLKYDRSFKLAGIGQTPWQRFGPQYWFDDYVVLCQDDLGLDHSALGTTVYQLPEIYERSGHSRESLLILVNSAWFIDLYNKYLSSYKFLTYKPVPSPVGINIKFAANHISIGDKYENKKHIREILSDQVDFPEFEILEVENAVKNHTYTSIYDRFGKFVVQDETMSSGSGTYVIKSESDYKDCLGSLAVHKRSIIISKFITGYDFSLQCCITKYGVFTGPLQKQVVDHKELGNTELVGVEKFNGAIVSKSYRQQIGEKNYQKVKDYSVIAGKNLASDGYKGIFSVDVFYDLERDDIFFLEINPRMTGVTPLYNLVQANSELPLPLLHILELSGIDYSIEDIAESDLSVKIEDSAILNIRSKSRDDYTQSVQMKSGQYTDNCEYISGSLNYSRDSITVHIFAIEGLKISAGDKLAQVFIPGRVEKDNMLAANYSIFFKKLYAKLAKGQIDS